MPVDVSILNPSSPVLQIVQSDQRTLVGLGTLLSPLRSGQSIQDLAVGSFVGVQTPILGMVVSAGTSPLTFTPSSLINSGEPSRHILGLIVRVGSPTEVQFGGVVALPSAAWDAVTGESGGLVSGGTYFLSPVGLLTRSPLPAAIPFQVGTAIDGVRMLLSTPRVKRI